MGQPEWQKSTNGDSPRNVAAWSLTTIPIEASCRFTDVLPVIAMLHVLTQVSNMVGELPTLGTAGKIEGLLNIARHMSMCGQPTSSADAWSFVNEAPYTGVYK